MALRPGQGQATFANYTSYSRGINCVIIDVSGMWTDVSGSDFSFRAGNSADPGTWAAAPTPNVRIEMVGTTRRIFLTWPDYDPANPNSTVNAVANKWLQVSVLANDRTGLPANDVFYFGNLIGDTGLNSTGLYATLAEDYSATRAVADDPAQNAAFLDSHYDHNRDGVHDDADYVVVQQNYFRTLYLVSV